MAEKPKDNENWFNDSQRIIALIFVLLFVGLMSLNGYQMMRLGSVNDVVEMQKQLINALINVVMVVVGFFFGASKTAKDQVESQARVAEKLAEKAALPVPPGPPMQSPTAAIVAWWSLLTDAERSAIEAAAAGSGDQRVAAFIEAAKAGAAAGDDLDYLVSKGLLAADRAAEIRKVGVT